MRYVPIALLAVFGPVAFASPGVVKLEAPPKAEWVTITCDGALTVLSTEKPGTWELVDEVSGAALRSMPDGKTACFTGPGGQYRVLVTTPDGVHRLKLIAPGPPQPLPLPPGPGPTPPPTPPPVPPSDPLVLKLQAAADLDTRDPAKKRTDLLDLVELYRQATDLAAKAEVTTTGELVARVRQASAILGIEGLTDVRRVIAAELAAGIGTADVPLTADSRKAAAIIFTKIKAALEQVK